MKTAVYAGTFDPITNGHLDVVERALACFDRLILAVGVNRRKSTLFTVEERLDLIRRSLPASLAGRVELDSFEGLLVEYVKSKGTNVSIRGLRAFSDFEFEFQMALTNRKLDPAIETLFLMPKEEYSYVSSSRVREVAALGGDIADFVSPAVADALRERVAAMEDG